MPAPLAHVYDLALRALDEQERRVAELRGRLTPVLAGGGVGVTLLAPAALDSGRAVLLGTSFVALGVSVSAAAYLLLAGQLSFGVDAATASRRIPAAAWRDEEAFLRTMARVLDRRRVVNRLTIERLQVAFSVMVCGMLVAVCGLALAAAIA